MRVDNELYKKDAEELAPLLVGRLICLQKESGELLRMRITETECYKGMEDTACHASRGRTERNSPLWMPGGFTYVYLCYGMYHMFNIISGREDDPQGVLVRGVEGYGGPGKFTRFAGIDRSFNCMDLRSSAVMWLEEDGFVPSLVRAKRVGIDYARPADRDRLWRFSDKRFFKK